MSVRTLYQRPELHTYLDAPVDAHHHAVVGTLLGLFGLGPGHRVVEFGAGSGRYTLSLLDHGLQVVALEPDPVLAAKLRARGAGRDGLTVWERAAGDLPRDLAPVHGACGFHVLHHFDAETLRALGRDICRLAGSPPGFRGWFFMEPNPYNVLYPLHIAVWPGMRFREERGIWRRDYAQIFAAEGLDYKVLGHIGHVPPGVARRVPSRWLRRLAPRLRRRRSLTALYRVVGGGPPRGQAC